jgi:ATP-binding cassette, subfamily B, bacterial PglK
MSKTQRHKFFGLTVLRSLIFASDLVAILLLAAGVNSLSSGAGESSHILLGGAALLMFIRSGSTLLISRATFRYLAEIEVQVGGNFTEKVFSAPQEVLDDFRSQDLAFALNQGTNSLTTRTLGFFLIIVSDGIALISLVIVFMLLYPLEGGLFVVMVMFTIVPVQQSVAKKIHDAASLWADSTVEMLQQVHEFQASRREIFLNSASQLMADRLNKFRSSAATASARFNFMLTVPRTLIEVATLAVTIVLIFVAYSRQPAQEFVVFTAILMAITFRIGPLGVGIIGALGVISQSQGETRINRELSSATASDKEHRHTRENGREGEYGSWAIYLQDVSYSFPRSSDPFLTEVSMRVLPNQVVALVGKSGSGKTTLLECITGIRRVNSGTLRIFGQKTEDIRLGYPGFIGLVSQYPAIARATVAENIALFSKSEPDRERVLSLLGKVGLQDFLDKCPVGIDSIIGEGALHISGGERQRLAIARALYGDPQILVMDEPTSALDGLSEEQVFDLIESERNNRTVFLITHRRPHDFLFDVVYEISDGAVNRAEG